MNTLHIPGALIMPAASMIDVAGGIVALRPVRNRCSVKLAPALVEDNPHGNTGVVVKAVDHLFELFFEIIAVTLLFPPRRPVAAIVDPQPRCDHRAKTVMKE